MPTPDVTFEFNMASRAKLNEQDRATLDAMEAEREQAKQRFDADYAQNGSLYRQQEEKRLTEHHRANHNMKPPPGVVREVPTAEQIRQKAADNVRDWYAKTRETMVRDARKRERDFVKAALGIQERPPRGLDQDRRLDLERR